MLNKLKLVIKLFVPPILLELIVNRNNRNTFDGVYNSFTDIDGLTTYNDDTANSEIYEDIIYKIGLYDDRQTSQKAHIRSQITNLLPLLIAANSDDELSVLDYGGGAGATFLECINSIDLNKVQYYIYDLEKTMKIGKKAFLNSKTAVPIFINEIEEIKSVDIIYLGSVLQYIQDYKALLISLMKKDSTYIFITDTFMGEYSSYITAQVNMSNRKMPYWIFQLDEIIEIFNAGGYNLVYSTVNYQPFHNFDNFPEKYRVQDTYNLLFKIKKNDY